MRSTAREGDSVDISCTAVQPLDVHVVNKEGRVCSAAVQLMLSARQIALAEPQLNISSTEVWGIARTSTLTDALLPSRSLQSLCIAISKTDCTCKAPVPAVPFGVG